MRLFPFLCAFLVALSAAIASEPGAFRLLRLANHRPPNSGEGDLVKWGPGALGSSAEITYAFATRPTNLENMIGDCSELEPIDPLIARNGIERAPFEEAVVAGLGLWENAAGVRFRRVDDDTHADLVIGASRRNLPITHARVSLRLGGPLAPGLLSLEKASICLDDDTAWSLADRHARGSVLSMKLIIAHEAGHVLGLDHPRDKNVLMGRSAESTLTELADGDREGAKILYGNTQLP